MIALSVVFVNLLGIENKHFCHLKPACGRQVSSIARRLSDDSQGSKVRFFATITLRMTIKKFFKFVIKNMFTMQEPTW
jgi:hypothetical protein